VTASVPEGLVSNRETAQVGGCAVTIPEAEAFSRAQASGAFDGMKPPKVEPATELLAALSAAKGYLLNAKIDLETGAPKRTAIATISGGIRMIDAALAKANPHQEPLL